MKKIILLAMLFALMFTAVACRRSDETIGDDDLDNDIGDITDGEETENTVQLWFYTGDGYVCQNGRAMTDFVFEPGACGVFYIKVVNATETDYDVSPTLTLSKVVNNIHEVLEAYLILDGFEGNVERGDLADGQTLHSGVQIIGDEAIRVKAGETEYFAVAFKMAETASNQYQGGSATIISRIVFSEAEEDAPAVGGDDNVNDGTDDGTNDDNGDSTGGADGGADGDGDGNGNGDGDGDGNGDGDGDGDGNGNGNGDGDEDDDRKPGGEIQFPSIDF